MYAWAWNVSFKRKKYFTESKWPCVFTNHTSILSTHTLPLPWISLGVLSLDVICLIDWLIMLEVNDPRALGSLPLSWEPETQSPVWLVDLPQTQQTWNSVIFTRKLLPPNAHHFPWGLKFWKKYKTFYREQIPCFSAKSSPLTLFDKSSC